MSDDDNPDRGYYQSHGFAADFAFWAKMPSWTARECAALLVGLNPDVAEGSREPKEPHSIWVRRSRYQSLSDLTRRASEGRVVRYPQSPSRWLAWAGQLDIPIASELADAVARYKGASESPPTEDARKIADLEAQLDSLRAAIGTAVQDVSARERDSMLKLIIGMAVAGYRYDPKAGRNAAVPEIVGDLEKHGVGLSDETVRRYLREASDLLPSPQKS